MDQITFIETILYVNNQEISTNFYQKIFRKTPDLNVPGMTEFYLVENCKIGLMPNKGIAKILTDKTPIRMKEMGYLDANCIFMSKIFSLNLTML